MNYIRSCTGNSLHDRTHIISIGYIFHMSHIGLLNWALVLIEFIMIGWWERKRFWFVYIKIWLNIFNIYANCFKINKCWILLLKISISSILLACSKLFISNSLSKIPFICLFVLDQGQSKACYQHIITNKWI